MTDGGVLIFAFAKSERRFFYHHLCYHQKSGKFLLRSIFWL